MIVGHMKLNMISLTKLVMLLTVQTGTTTTFAFWFDGDNDKIYYYNHTDGYGLKNNTALISNSNGKIISSMLLVQK